MPSAPLLRQSSSNAGPVLGGGLRRPERSGLPERPGSSPVQTGELGGGVEGELGSTNLGHSCSHRASGLDLQWDLVKIWPVFSGSLLRIYCKCLRIWWDEKHVDVR